MEKVSEGPLGVGTRYRGKWRKFGMLEWTFLDFDRPHKFTTHDGTMSIGRGVHYLTFHELSDKITRFDQVFELGTKRYFRPLEPLLKLLLAQRLKHIGRKLKEYLED